MPCEVVELLERINRLSEIALEFHGEELGDLATANVIETALDIDMRDEDELFEDEGSFDDSEEVSSGGGA